MRIKVYKLYENSELSHSQHSATPLIELVKKHATKNKRVILDFECIKSIDKEFAEELLTSIYGSNAETIHVRSDSLAKTITTVINRMHAERMKTCPPLNLDEKELDNPDRVLQVNLNYLYGTNVLFASFENPRIALDKLGESINRRIAIEISFKGIDYTNKEFLEPLLQPLVNRTNVQITGMCWNVAWEVQDTVNKLTNKNIKLLVSNDYPKSLILTW